MDADDADTACHLVQLEVEETEDDEAEVEITPLALLYVRGDSTATSQSYQSMTATLGFEDSDGSIQNSEVCVDSGAASCSGRSHQVHAPG